MEALRSNISTKISVLCLIIYFCGKQPNKRDNVATSSQVLLQNKDVHYPLLINLNSSEGF